MHTYLVTPQEARFNAEDQEGPTVAGWYVRDHGGWHGPFLDGYAEAERFIAYCESQDRAEMRHNRSLMYPGV